jgi:polyisoprenoid-binding protein YceI
VRIVVMPDAVEDRPDAVALLRDEVHQLADGLQALTQAVGDNFQRLQQADEATAAARHAELTAALAALEPVRAQMASTLQRLEAIERQLLALPDLVAAAAPAPPATSAVAGSTAIDEPTAAPAANAAPEPEVRPSTPGPATVAAAPAAPAPARAAGSFLTFAMPGATMRFDQPQHYVLLPELSRVGFDAKSTLHDFTGVTSQLAGAFTADFDDPDGNWSGRVTCAAATLRTGVDGRDANMLEHLDTEHHPDICFDLQRFVPQPDGIDVGRQTARGEVVGTMTIRGKSRELRMPVRVTVDAGKRVVIAGETPLKLTDFEVPVPSQLGIIGMQDEVKVWVSLRARAKVGP